MMECSTASLPWLKNTYKEILRFVYNTFNCALMEWKFISSGLNLYMIYGNE